MCLRMYVYEWAGICGRREETQKEEDKAREKHYYILITLILIMRL